MKHDNKCDLAYQCCSNTWVVLSSIPGWLFAGELKLQYLDKPYYVSLGLYQMSILLQYNDCDRYTADELRERTKLEQRDWTRHALPLLDSKILLLVGRLLKA